MINPRACSRCSGCLVSPSPKVLEALSKAPNSFLTKTSPPTQCTSIINQIAQYFEVNKENIIIGAGSSELIFRLLPKILTDKSKPTTIIKPAYREYEHFLKKQGHNVLSFFTDNSNFEVNCHRLIEDAIKNEVNAIILINPNNPSGSFLAKEEIFFY